MSAVKPGIEGKSKECTEDHCFAAFDALYCALTKDTPIEPSFPDEKYPLFVTWNIRSRRGESRLRGCIGNFQPMAIREGIAEYALISAFEDHRFNPIQKSELERLECGISLLTDFEDAESWLDWTEGVHGIQISFTHPFYSGIPQSSDGTPISSTPSLFGNLTRRVANATMVPKRRYSATYLPDVIPAQGWTKQEAVDSAIRKSGWNERITDELRRSIQLRRYQSSKAEVGWEDYVHWRESKGRPVSL